MKDRVLGFKDSRVHVSREKQGSRILGFKGSRAERKHWNPGPLASLNPLLRTLESWTPGILEPFFLLFLLLSFLLPSLAWADGISGIVELNYTTDRTRTEDSGGLSTETKNSNFTQRYFLNLDRKFYPNLEFHAGGIFEKTNTTNETESAAIKTTSTVKNGLLGLQLKTRMISSGLGYTIREDQQSIQGLGATVPSVMETYSANLALRPEGIPPLDTLFQRTHLYDKEKVSQDSVTDSLSLSTRYQPIKDLDLQGQVFLSDFTDKLGGIHVKSSSYTGRAAYSRQFFGDRVSTAATYNFARRGTDTTTGGTGEVLFQAFPFSGLSSLSDTPPLVTLDLNPALIDGDLAASSGINIGHVAPGGDSRRRNIGIDFVNPSEVNTIYIWVDKELPANVSNKFSWEIWISSDNLIWTLWQTVSAAPFGPFLNRFAINFSNISTRYLKVVTSPLSPAVIVPPALNDIFITEMQTFLRRSSQDVTGKTTQTTHVYDLSAKWRILDRPNLYYDFYYWGARSQPTGTSLYILTNGLNLIHRFNKVFAGTARIAHEDGSDGKTNRSANVYSASVTAVPLPTLYHSLVASGRFEQSARGSFDSHSLFLNNSAEFYKGVNVNLAGGASLSNDEKGRQNVTSMINSGVAIVPNPALNLSLSYSQSNSRETGGGLAETSSFTRSGSISAGYTPFSTLYIFASLGMNAQNDRKTQTVQSYAVSWSPFQEGDLQFNFAYTESITSENQKTRTGSSGLVWNLRRNVELDVSYGFVQDESLVQKAKTKVLSTTLRIIL